MDLKIIVFKFISTWIRYQWQDTIIKSKLNQSIVTNVSQEIEKPRLIYWDILLKQIKLFIE